MNIDEILLDGINRVTSDPEVVTLNCKKCKSLQSYWRIQYWKMTGAAACTGFGGIFLGSALSVASVAATLRFAANMTYAYGYHNDVPVDTEDFLAVLAIWMGQRPDDIVSQCLTAQKRVKAPMAKAKAAYRVTLKISEKLAEKLAEYAAKSLAAKIAQRVLSAAAPVVGTGVFVFLVKRDYDHIKRSIKSYYASKNARLAAISATA